MKPPHKESFQMIHILQKTESHSARNSARSHLGKTVVTAVLLFLVWLLPRSSEAQMVRCSPGNDTVLSLFHDRYSVQLGAFAQLQYAAGVRDGELVRSDFTVPRARICASGHAVTKRLRYRLMVGRSIQREIEVNDAYAEWEPVDGLLLRLGRMKLPIIHEWIESAQPLSTIDRALASRLMLPGRDYGARVSGLLLGRHLEYLLGVWNGDGDSATKAADTSPAIVARVGLHLTGSPYIGAVDFDGSAPAVSLEFGTMWNRWKPSATTNPATQVPQMPQMPQLEDTLLNASALLRWGHFDGAAEYIGLIRRDDQDTTYTHAGYLRLTYFVPRVLSSATLRASIVKVRGKKPDEQLELEADYGVYVDRHRAKIVLRYGIVRNLLQGTVEHQVGLQAQVAVN